jgi:DNA replication protein DnaC
LHAGKPVNHSGGTQRPQYADGE